MFKIIQDLGRQTKSSRVGLRWLIFPRERLVNNGKLTFGRIWVRIESRPKFQFVKIFK